MPASTMDSITSALKADFVGSNSGGANGKPSLVESGLLSSAKKNLLSTPVAFDPPVRLLGGASNALGGVIKKSTTILLNSKRAIGGSSNGDGHPRAHPDKNDAPASPPRPKVVYYPPENIKVGYAGQRRPGAGMQNLGNTCYLNSTLQALFHTPSLFNYLTNGGHQRQCKMQSSNNGFVHSACMICALTGTLKDTLNSSVTRPNRIYDRLKTICKHLMHGRQEDAHEFMRYLIEALQRCFLVSAGAPKSLDTASKETTPFNQIFGGYLQQDVTCLKCYHVSVTFQHFMDLLVDIRQASSVSDALTHYFRAERIGDPSSGGDSMYRCERCKARVPAKKRSFICRPPIALCIQLKRFSLMGGKISKPVHLEKIINVKEFVKCATPTAEGRPDLKYKMVSMVTHVGPSPNCGHYTAIGEASNGQYYQFDDSSVRPISTAQAQNTASYIVIYEMLPSTKRAWIDEGGVDGRDDGPVDRAASLAHRVVNGATPKPAATVTSQTIGPQLPPGFRKVAPSVIRADGTVASSKPYPSPSLGARAPNAIGVVTKGCHSQPPVLKRSLVPYGEEADDDASDEHSGTVSLTKARPASNGSGRNGHGHGLNGRPPTPASSSSPVPPRAPFVPRQVTMKTMSRTAPAERKSEAVSLLLPVHERPSSAVSSSSGSWTVTDAEEQSTQSDKSTGSTSQWRVSSQAEGHDGTKPIEAPQRSLVAREAFQPEARSHEKRMIKRTGSMDEYEADLDRGRAKKVKKDRPESQTRAQSAQNPFQAHQNRSYNGWTDKNAHQGHRDHSYHASHNNGYRDNRWNPNAGGGGFRRSQSSSSLNSDRDRYRDQRHSGGGFGSGGRDRFYNGGGGGGYNHHRDFGNHNRNRRHGHNQHRNRHYHDRS